MTHEPIRKAVERFDSGFVCVPYDELKALLADLDRVTRELDEALKDARRYRWLRDAAPGEIVFDHVNDDCRFELYVPFDGEPIDNDEQSAKRLDAAIDAALGDVRV